MQPIQVAIVPVTMFAQNCSIVACTVTKEAAVVDPGGDLPRIQAALDQFAVKATKILLTHGHVDHAAGAAELAETLGIPIEGPQRGDDFLLKGLAAEALRFGLTGARPVTPTRWLEEGDEVAVGRLTFSVLHVPGHSPGHIVFVLRQAPFALVGDTLFAGSIGRTDMPYGSHDLLIQGIRTKLLPLGDEVTILPGHGPASSIGAERQSNPYVSGR